MKKTFKIISFFIGIFFLLAGFVIFGYLKFLPWLVSNETVINKIEEIVKNTANIELNIVNPRLETSFSSNIAFKLESLTAVKENIPLSEVKNLKIDISFGEIFHRKIV